MCYCVYCGSKIDAGDHFCVNCGKPVIDCVDSSTKRNHKTISDWIFNILGSLVGLISILAFVVVNVYHIVSEIANYGIFSFFAKTSAYIFLVIAAIVIMNALHEGG